MMRWISTLAAGLVLTLAGSALAFNPLDASDEPTFDGVSQWTLNMSGWGTLDGNADVLPIMQESFDSWSSPCCSAFRHSYLGTSLRSGSDTGNGENTLSWEGSTWPPEFGSANQTIAVTLPQWYTGRSTLIEADMLFNGVGFQFVNSSSISGNRADLQAIATHEIGHWLGLDHDPLTTPCGPSGGDARHTMCPDYSSGILERSLSDDDVNGVCYLYPGDCSCTSDGDCLAGESCVSGTCVEPPCSRDSDCAGAMICVSGECISPPCTSDSDCASGQICSSGACVASGDCTICASCTTQADCGGSSYLCAEGTGLDPFCTRVCNSHADCPGDSSCFGIEGEDFNLCLNPNAADAGICNSGYVCAGGSTGTDPTDDCVVCDTCTDSSQCGTSGTCVSFDGVSAVCSTFCDGGAGCPTNTSCFEVENSDTGEVVYLCLNSDVNEAGPCPAGFTCGDTTTDPCAGVSCPAGQTCNATTGICEGPIDRCAGVSCPSGQTCNSATGLCEGGTSDPCAGVSCPSGQTCNPTTGVCEGTSGLCDGVSCPSGQTCNPTTGVCEGGSTGICDGVVCNPGDRCNPTTGVCEYYGASADCPVCTPCAADHECGTGGECVDFGGGGVCTVDCSADQATCPGDSACFMVPTETRQERWVCLNPNVAAAGACPSSYRCREPVEDESPPASSSGGCSSTPSRAPMALWALGIAALLRRRRR